MLWKLVERFEAAADEASALASARDLVAELKASPLSVHFSGVTNRGRCLIGATASVAVRGRQTGIIQSMEISMDPARTSVRAVVPKVREPGDTAAEAAIREVMEEGTELAMSADRTAEALESVGVAVERALIAGG